jgi:hypothetical protein
MAGLLIGLAVIAAVVAVWWRRRSDTRAARRIPGATVNLPIAVRSFDEIDAALDTRRCDCGELLTLSGETSRQTKHRRFRIVRLVCPDCEREYLVHFDVTAVFH